MKKISQAHWTCYFEIQSSINGNKAKKKTQHHNLRDTVMPE